MAIAAARAVLVVQFVGASVEPVAEEGDGGDESEEATHHVQPVAPG